MVYLPTNIEVFTLKKPSYTAEFKRAAADLVVNQGYGIREASEAVGVGQSAIRKWVLQLRGEQSGVTPKGSAITQEQQKIQELEADLSDSDESIINFGEYKIIIKKR